MWASVDIHGRPERLIPIQWLIRSSSLSTHSHRYHAPCSKDLHNMSPASYSSNPKASRASRIGLRLPQSKCFCGVRDDIDLVGRDVHLVSGDEVGENCIVLKDTIETSEKALRASHQLSDSSLRDPGSMTDHSALPEALVYGLSAA